MTGDERDAAMIALLLEIGLPEFDDPPNIVRGDE